MKYSGVSLSREIRDALLGAGVALLRTAEAVLKQELEVAVEARDGEYTALVHMPFGTVTVQRAVEKWLASVAGCPHRSKTEPLD
ncbi:MAG: hypothetical protein WA441_10505 [Methyloceanibacter sp.]